MKENTNIDNLLGIAFYLPTKTTFKSEDAFYLSLVEEARKSKFSKILPKAEELKKVFKALLKDELKDLIKTKTNKSEGFVVSVPQETKVLLCSLVEKQPATTNQAWKELAKKLKNSACSVMEKSETKVFKQSDEVKNLIKLCKAGTAESDQIIHYLAFLHEILLENNL